MNFNNNTFGSKYQFVDQLNRQYRKLSDEEMMYFDNDFADTHHYMVLMIRIPRHLTAKTNNSTLDDFIELPNMSDIINLKNKDNNTHVNTSEVIEVISDYTKSVNTGIIILRDQ
jgi:hypothetical protein